jgi:predicted nucleic acid-binding protein
MNLVDSCGWLEYFADGPNTKFFAAPLEDISNLIVPTICILEVFKRILQQRGEDAALQAVAIMQQGHIVELSTAIALAAAKSSFKFDLPLADGVILATAQMYNAIIWTQDADFKDLEGVKYTGKR